jgi:hypothetical protein
MEEFIDTGINDKTDRSILVGDVVQYRLGKFAKSGGAKAYEVIKHGKKYHLVGESDIDNKNGGILLTPMMSKNLVVIKSNHIRG